jgi:hypothetical protein
LQPISYTLCWQSISNFATIFVIRSFHNCRSLEKWAIHPAWAIVNVTRNNYKYCCQWISTKSQRQINQQKTKGLSPPPPKKRNDTDGSKKSDGERAMTGPLNSGRESWRPFYSRRVALVVAAAEMTGPLSSLSLSLSQSHPFPSSSSQQPKTDEADGNPFPSLRLHLGSRA